MCGDRAEISSIQERKKVLRHELTVTAAGGKQAVPLAGRAAEILRRSSVYRSAKQVFVAPQPALQQVRINCLADGKALVMATAGLKEGFCFLKPYTVPFRDLAFAVSLKGAAKFGHLLNEKEIADLDLSLLVTAAVAVDRQGGRLGMGSGFFDLSYAILCTMGGVSKTAQVAACIAQEQIVDRGLPMTCWDVPLNLLVTQDEVQMLAAPSSPATRIYWDHLPAKRIRKLKPLWLLKKLRTEDNGQKG